MANIVDNVLRHLNHFGLERDLLITSHGIDRVWAWPTNDRILVNAVVRGWDVDGSLITQVNHGTQTSAREPGGVRPAMQICFHPAPKGSPHPYFLEIDFDYASPAGGFKSFFIHAGEVIGNALSGAKTNQDKIAAGLTRRGIA